jgi:glyoxylase-like metal-dependent hydrolase (beta-lactamase superfamily II)
MAVAFILALGATWLLTARRVVHATPGNVTLVAPGVWFREGDLKSLGHCNNVWIEMNDYVIVVDANFPSGAEACLADVKRTTRKPVKYVFDTHHHGDHAYGNPIWTRLGAITLAHVGVAEEMKRYEPMRWQEAARARKDVAALELPTAEPPQQTFKEDTFILQDATRRVEFRFLGWAHTRGDGFVYLPKEKVLCTGDAVANGPYNYMGDGNSANWPLVIEKARQLDVTTVLPGHGPPGGKEVLNGQAQFFVELRKSVADAIRSGKKLPDLIIKQGQKTVGTSITLPASVQNWVDKEGLPGDVEVVYKEMTTGKPHGEILGGR